MLERQEIDALLISALYGELSPAEESRLAAHFESHPADKTALAALTSTRDAVRESRILQVQVDPPQSVSAMLLQEAARRAPKPPEKEGWFARLARSFMAHPAMAAAMMLVVVLGVATIVHNRKGAGEMAPAATANETAAGSGSAAMAPVMPPSADRERHLENGAVADHTTQGVAAGSAAGSDSFAVSIADDQTKNTEGDKVGAKDDADSWSRRDLAKAEAQQQAQDAKRLTTAKGKDVAQEAKKAAPTGGIEVRRPEPTPKELDGAPANVDYESVPAKEQANAITPGPSGVSGGGVVAGTTAGRGASAGDTGGYAVPPPTTGTANNAPRPTDTRTATTAPAPGGGGAPSAAPARNQGPSTQPAPKVAQNAPAPPPRAANTKTPDAPRGAAPADEPADKSANDPQLAWAREQHTAIVARVRAGDCKGAANIGVGLWNRDPAYFQQNVATDRAVKDCLSYITAARDRDASERAERSKAAAQKQRANEPARRVDADRPAATIDSTK